MTTAEAGRRGGGWGKTIKIPRGKSISSPDDDSRRF